MVYRHKYTWCKIVKKKRKEKKNKTNFYWVSCIRILDYRGSQLEAQMGIFYLVRHCNFTYNIITEIKQALHNRVLLPHIFSFQDYGGYEHKLTDHKICISQRHLRYSPLTVCNVFTNLDTDSATLAEKNSSFRQMELSCVLCAVCFNQHHFVALLNS